ncbi:MAG: Flp pilus assembly complex ATPase component TadA [Planctomycetales bacterium]|nr:Flp pilus assembly complex ATPase component TadA [Planctomycetales bacterium]
MANPTKIMVAVDFSDCCTAALDHACELAKQFGAQLHLVHVVTGTQSGSMEEQDLIRIGLEKLNSLITPESELALKTEKHALAGASAQRVIVEHARTNDIDLIVMGTHGRKGLVHFALGSVAERVLRSAPCPVMVLQPANSLSQTKERAIKAISSQFGESVEGKGNRSETIQAVQACVTERLEITEANADQVIDALQQDQRLRWRQDEADDNGRLEIILHEVAPSESPSYSESPAIDLIHRAKALRATDVHLDPKSHGEYVVRFRIDGELEHYCVLSRDVAEHLINRFKTIARIDIAAPFTPHESRLTLPESMEDLEVRITTAPVAAGESVALRLFALENVFRPLDTLGFANSSLDTVDAVLRKGEGLVLVTGPTGAGKTTTVYSMLQSLAASKLNIVSIEDPVEFATPFIRQMNVDAKHGITMASGLRTMLRMDPDVIFVGEIRDAEAALIAMQAASSGRYVFSTLHTRDVASTITALRDMNVADRSLAGNLNGIVNQRLVRRLCPDCRIQYDILDEERTKFEANSLDAPATLYRRSGCDACRHTGYRGRVGIFEAALIDREIGNAIVDEHSEQSIRDLLSHKGVTSLTSDALHKAATGITDIGEALGVHWL